MARTLEPHGRGGRPRSPVLTARLVQASLDILTSDGWHRLNADRLVGRVGAGKAAVYRRWSCMADLARAALSSVNVIAPPQNTGSVGQDLATFLAPLRRPLSSAEKAAASLLGASLYHPQLQAALEERVAEPLAVATRQILTWEVDRGGVIPDDAVIALTGIIQALWWQRLAAVEEVWRPEDLSQLIADVLLPLISAPPARLRANAS